MHVLSVLLCVSGAASMCTDFRTQDECAAQLCENGAHFCAWTAEGCGCPTNCKSYSGLEGQCEKSYCPDLLQVGIKAFCTYDSTTRACSCSETAKKCEDFKGDHEGCVNTACPNNADVKCDYDRETLLCSCPTEAPETKAPETDAPATNAPATDAPRTLTPGALTPCNTSLLTNPSFDNIVGTTAQEFNSGNVVGWGRSHGSPSLFGGYHGAYSAWMWSQQGFGEGIVTSFAFLVGVQYRVTMWVHTNNPDGNIFVRIANGVPISTSTSNAMPSVSSAQTVYTNGMVFPTAQEITFDFTANANYAQMWFYPFLAALPANGQAEWRIDNIRVCNISETTAPATRAPATRAPQTEVPAPRRCEEFKGDHEGCVNTACPNNADVKCDYDRETLLCSCPTEAPETKAPETRVPAPRRCEEFKGDHEGCVNTACPNNADVRCDYDLRTLLCSCPTSAPETKAPETKSPAPRRCEEFKGDHEGCVNTACPNNANVKCDYDRETLLCSCPTEAPETKAPETRVPAPRRCEEFKGDHEGCVNTACPNNADVRCDYDLRTLLCSCPTSAPETKAPETKSPAPRRCEEFKGDHEGCVNTACPNNANVKCDYDRETLLCSCPTSAPETKAPETKSPAPRRCEEFKGDHEGCVNTACPNNADVKCDYDRETLLCSCPTEAPETKAPETRAPQTKSPAPRRCEEFKGDHKGCVNTTCPNNADVKCDYDLRTLLCSCPTSAPETKAPETKSPAPRRCEEFKGDHEGCVNTACPNNADVKCDYDRETLLCSCPTEAPETKAPETRVPTPRRCEEFKGNHKGCVTNACPNNADVRCDYDLETLLCTCPTEAPETKSPETKSPAPRRCEEFKGDHEGCVNTACPNNADVKCDYDRETLLCTCPTEAPETKAPETRAPQTKSPAPRRCEEFKGDHKGCVNTACPNNADVKCDYDLETLLCSCPTSAPETKAPETKSPAPRRCEEFKGDHEGCVNTACPNNADVKCDYDRETLLCTCPTEAPETKAPETRVPAPRRCEEFKGDHRGCVTNACPNNADVRCDYDLETLLCSCPTEAPETKAPETKSPAPRRCEEFKGDHEGCVNTACPNNADVKCDYDRETLLCSCPTEAPETKAPETRAPQTKSPAPRRCEEFKGDHKGCVNTTCPNNADVKCDYDLRTLLCSCPTNAPETKAPETKSPAPRRCEEFKGDHEGCVNTACPNNADVRCDYDRETLLCTCPTEAPETKAPETRVPAPRRCEEFKGDHRGCVTNACPNNADVKCDYDLETLLCSCPTEAPETKAPETRAPETKSPAPRRCEEFKGDHKGCVNTTCPNNADVKCDYDLRTLLCSCPTSAPETRAPQTKSPAPRRCEEFKGDHKGCVNTTCPNNADVKCDYDLRTLLCSCPTSAPETRAPQTKSPAPRRCEEFKGDHEGCVNTACPNNADVKCDYDRETLLCSCPTEAPETKAPTVLCSEFLGDERGCVSHTCEADADMYCMYDRETRVCSCPTEAPATRAPATRAPRTEAPETMTPPLEPCTTSILTNPSFDTIVGTAGNAFWAGNVPGWFYSHGTPSLFGGYHGPFSAWMWSYSGAGEGVVTNVPFTAGLQYRVTMWVHTNNPDGNIFVRIANGVPMGTSASTAFPSVTSAQTVYTNGMVFPTAQEITFDFTANANYAQMWFYPFLAAWATNGQAEFRIDNIRVCVLTTDAPETRVPQTEVPIVLPGCAQYNENPRGCFSSTCEDSNMRCQYDWRARECSCPTAVPESPAPRTETPVPRKCEEFNSDPRSCWSNTCEESNERCQYDWRTRMCTCPTQAPESKAPPTAAPRTETPISGCEQYNGSPRGCFTNTCDATSNTRCQYDWNSRTCTCPTKAPETEAPPAGCEQYDLNPRACFSNMCEGTRTRCQYDWIARTCTCPTEAPETAAPRTEAPVITSCSRANGNPKLCLSTPCTDSIVDTRCSYDYETNVCSCPTKAPETAAPRTETPVIYDCARANGNPKLCTATPCTDSSVDTRCSYDFATRLCSCPTRTPETAAPRTEAPVITSCSRANGNPKLCLSTPCTDSIVDTRCSYDYETNVCSCPTKAPETAAPRTRTPISFPTGCARFKGNHKGCVNQRCSLNERTLCVYDIESRICSCPTSAPDTRAPPTPAPATPTPPLQPCTRSLLSNPSFDITTPSGSSFWGGHVVGWYYSHGTPSLFGGFHGAYSAWMWSYSGRGEGVVTNFNFVSGTQYRITMWVETNNPDGNIYVRLANGVPMSVSSSTAFPSVTSAQTVYTNGMVFPTAQEITFDFTAGANYAQLWFFPYLSAFAHNGQAEFRIDNIRVCRIGTEAPAEELHDLVVGLE